jgi:hypothetical protein
LSDFAVQAYKDWGLHDIYFCIFIFFFSLSRIIYIYFSRAIAFPLLSTISLAETFFNQVWAAATFAAFSTISAQTPRIELARATALKPLFPDSIFHFLEWNCRNDRLFVFGVVRFAPSENNDQLMRRIWT